MDKRIVAHSGTQRNRLKPAYAPGRSLRCHWIDGWINL